MSEDGASAAAKKYDYIIVGGGTAGCPLAATLSAKYSILVIERGGSPYGDPEIQNASAYGDLLGETDNYTSPAQSFITEDGLTLARARVLGGGTALNAAFYSRASSQYVRSMGWDAGLVEQSYEWVEKQNAFKPYNLSTWSSIFKNGLLEAGIVPDNGYTLDHVEGTKISASTFDNNGKRHTAADLLKSANSNNIVVLLNATVSRILFNTSSSQGKKGGSYGKPRAGGVEFMDARGRTYQAFLKDSSPSSEVIVSAGSIGSPQLLLLSGIGPSEHLKEFNIPLVLHLPLVGQGIQDSPRATVTLQSPTPMEFSSIQVVGIPKGSQIYIESSCFVLPASASVNGSASSSPKHIYAGNIFEKLAFPLSRGELRLRSRDPRGNPSVRYNYYSNPLDVQNCVQGVRMISKLLNTRSLKGFASSAVNKSANGTTANGFQFIGQALPKNTRDDAAMAQFCRDTVNTMWHFHGGCHVGAVVNQRYQVIGVDSLRIVDGSTFKDGPGTNPQATTMMLGRYMGLKILQERA
jgi:choline dehydrogenase